METATLIDSLVDDCKPVRRLRRGYIVALFLAIFALMICACAGAFGLRANPLDLLTERILLIRTICLLGIGALSTWAAIDMTYPSHIGHQRAWFWPLVFGLFAISLSLLRIFSGLQTPMAIWLDMRRALPCLGIIGLTSTPLSILVAYILRRGATTELALASWLTGLSGSSFGALAFSIHCPYNDILFVGIWYPVAIVISTMLTRLWVMPFIRW